MKRIAFLPANQDACALFRLFMPHLHTPSSIYMFHAQGLEMSRIAGCEVVAVQRLCTKQNYEALKTLKRTGLKVIYDLDDNMWAIPSYNPAHRLFKQLEPGFRICATEADVITVSTEPLRVAVKKAIGKQCPPVEVIQNAMDFEWFHPLPDKLRTHRGDRVTIGWAGTNTHTGDVEQVFNLLPKLLDRVPNLYLEFVGLPAPNVIRQHPRVKERDFVPVAEWPARWASWQWDASFAPLNANKFNNSKSNIKALEAAALGIPCVVSDVAPYHDFCAKSPLLRENLLCRGIKDWEEKMMNVTIDSGLRRKLGAEMMRVGREFYDVSRSVARWKELADAI